MPDLVVDAELLAALGGEFQSVAGHIEATFGVGKNAASSAEQAAGDHGLSSAIKDFWDAWQPMLHQYDDLVRSMGQIVVAVADDYLVADGVIKPPHG